MTKSYMPPAKTVEWSTPQWLFDALDAEFHFTVDAAASAENAKCERYWTKHREVECSEWVGQRVFCNPPFGVKDLAKFSERACWSVRCPNTGPHAMIVPVKADQRWWHDYALQAEIRFIRGRVTFGSAPSCFPGPIAVLVFGTGRSGCYSMERLK
jgi:site-specific DNA-methyltransferase (adenine-specific)